MKRNHDLQKWQPYKPEINNSNLDHFPHLNQNFQQLFGQMMNDIDKWFQPKQLDAFFQQMNQQMNQQAQIQETDQAYFITVRLDGIEHPDDIQVQIHENLIRLQRIVQHEMKKNSDFGAIWKTSYQHFERTFPLEAAIDWQGREIQAQKGVWMIKLPKK